jgi:hypothetical protein
VSEQWPSKEQEIWFQAGVIGERERIIKLLDTTRMCHCNPKCETDINVVAFLIEELGLNVIDLIKEGQDEL